MAVSVEYHTDDAPIPVFFFGLHYTHHFAKAEIRSEFFRLLTEGLLAFRAIYVGKTNLMLLLIP